MKKSKSGPLRALLSGAVIVASSALIAQGASASVTELSHYSFEDLSTANVATDSLASNHGAAFGDPIPSSSADVPYVSPENLESAQFNGQNYFQIENSLGDNFSICAWAKTASFGGGAHWTSAPIVDSESGGWALDYGFGINNEGKVIFGNGGFNPEGGGYDSWVNGTSVVNDSTWHHLCATRDNSNGDVKIYVDGKLDASGTTGTGLLKSNPNIKIGNGSDGNQPFVGLIDDLRLYTSVLSLEEVQAVFQPVLPDPEETSEPESGAQALADTGSKNFGNELLPIALGLILIGIALLILARRKRPNGY